VSIASIPLPKEALNGLGGRLIYNELECATSADC
jgi:hypothetical protein